MELQRLKGKTALITGGGSGFGRATALRFAAEGAAQVFLVDLKQDRLDRVVGELAATGARATGLCADVGLSADCRRVVDTAVETAGRLDILISNAAAWTEEAFLDMQEDSWNRVIAVNLSASFLLGQAAGRVMKEQGGGVIAYTSSISSLGASKLFAHYGVTKAGIVNLVQNMAIELAPYKIRVNCVSPGPANTQQSRDIVGEELMQEFQHSFPLVPLRQRLIEPEEIAAAFAFLASDDAAMITGQNVVVDGGLTAHAYSIPEGSA